MRYASSLLLFRLPRLFAAHCFGGYNYRGINGFQLSGFAQGAAEQSARVLFYGPHQSNPHLPNDLIRGIDYQLPVPYASTLLPSRRFFADCPPSGGSIATSPNTPTNNGFIPSFLSAYGPHASPTSYHRSNYQGLNVYQPNGLGQGAEEQGARSLFLRANPHSPSSHDRLSDPSPVLYPAMSVPSSQRFLPLNRPTSDASIAASHTNVTVMLPLNATPRVSAPQAQATSSLSTTTADTPENVRNTSSAPNVRRRTVLHHPLPNPQPLQLIQPKFSWPSRMGVFDNTHPKCIEKKLQGGPRKGKVEGSGDAKVKSGGDAEASTSSKKQNKRKRNERDEVEQQIERDAHRPLPPPPLARVKGKGKAQEETSTALETSTVPDGHSMVSTQASHALSMPSNGDASGSSSFNPYYAPPHPQAQAWAPHAVYPAPYFPFDYSQFSDHFGSDNDFGPLPGREYLNSNKGALDNGNATQDNYTAENTLRSESEVEGGEIVTKPLLRESGLRGSAQRQSLTELNLNV